MTCLYNRINNKIEWNPQRIQLEQSKHSDLNSFAWIIANCLLSAFGIRFH